MPQVATLQLTPPNERPLAGATNLRSYNSLELSVLSILAVATGGDPTANASERTPLGGRNKLAVLQFAGIECVIHFGGRHRWRPYS